MNHPSADLLTALLQGRLPDASAESVAAHLASCVGCQQAAETQPDDPLWVLVRKVLPDEAPRASPIESWVPVELMSHPRYRLLSWLGAGGMGVVYRAEHRLMERTVAIKVINKTLTTHPVAVERFQREVKAAAKLAHPCIVAAYDAEQAGDLHFLVMEYVEGINLARLVEEVGPLQTGFACDLVRQVARGLQHAHEHGLIHRDIKPQNLMFTPKGQVKILDFGLASFSTESFPGRMTGIGQGLGTPGFVAPEQVRDARKADIRADIFSLGCTLQYLLTGSSPFASTVQLTVLPMQVSQRRLLLPETLPAELRQLLERMTAVAVSERYQTPADVIEALASLPWGLPSMTERWFYKQAGQVIGPIPTEQLQELLAKGTLQATALVLKSGSEQWVAAESIPAFQTICQRGVENTVRSPGQKNTLVTSVAFDVELRPEDDLIPTPLGQGETRTEVRTQIVPNESSQPATTAAAFVASAAATAAAGPQPPRWLWLVAGSLIAALLVVVLSVLVFRMRTPAGTLVVEIDQEGAEVLVDGKTITIVSAKTKADPLKIEVQDGKHELKVTKGGFASYSRAFSIQNGGTESIRVRLEPLVSSSGSLKTDSEMRPFRNSIGMEFMPIPAGKFIMGSPKYELGRSGGEDEHSVEITRPFWVGKYEVTRGQFRKFVEGEGYQTEAEKDGKGGTGYDPTTGTLDRCKPEYTWKNPGFAQTDEHPVVNVSWNDAVAFCNWLSAKEGKPYVLPTEAQWEYSCRAKSTTRFHNGDRDVDLKLVSNIADISLKTTLPKPLGWEQHWNDGYPFTAPVGQFQANGFGLHDMHGNVWEWCKDWYDDKYYQNSPSQDPVNLRLDTFRVFRGGSWVYEPRYARSAFRDRRTASYCDCILGFRVVLPR